MKLNTLSIMSRCATFELVNTACYTAPETVTAEINGKAAGSFNTNVFTIFGLCPGTEYTAEIKTGEYSFAQKFTTKNESALLNVRDFGAKGDGLTQDTAAINAAIACCPQGGTVYLPAGNYLSLPVFLKSDITFYLEKGAVLRGVTDRSQYPILPGMAEEIPQNPQMNLGTWEGDPQNCFASLITAVGASNIAVAGEGIIDGGGAEGDWWHDERTMRTAWRPRTVYLNRCKNVSMVGVTVQNSPSWTVHPYYCDNLKMLNLTILNPDDSPNTDGLNPESCDDVLIAGTKISVGDDCIAIKSGKIFMGENLPKPSQNITVRNCLMERGHGAVVLGSEVASGVSDIRIENCLMQQTDRGLRVKTRRGRGERSVITGICFSNVIMQRVKIPFSLNMFYFCDVDGHDDYVQNRAAFPVDGRTPAIGSLSIRNVTCTECEAAGIYALGLAESPIEMLDFEDVKISFAENAAPAMPVMADYIDPVLKLGIYAKNVKTIKAKNVVITGAEGEEIQLDNVEAFERV